jgi:hypothetical protein
MDPQSFVWSAFVSHTVWQSIATQGSTCNDIFLGRFIDNTHDASTAITEVHLGGTWGILAFELALISLDSTVTMDGFLEDITLLSELIFLTDTQTMEIERAQLLIILALMWMGNT